MSLPAYLEYKDPEVRGMVAIPKHWSTAPLKRLLDIQNGADYKAVEADRGYPVIGSGGQFAYATQYLHDGEAVLLGRKGTIDRPLYVNCKFWTVDTMYFGRIRPSVCGRFAYYAATTLPFKLYSTNTALPSMTKGALDAHVIAVPPFEEQYSIAAFLDRETAKIDALIAEQERLLALLAEKRQATITDAVTRGLNPSAPMSDSGTSWLGEVPAHWKVSPLGALAARVSYGFTNPMPTTEDGPYLLTANDIGMGTIRYATARHTSWEAFNNLLTDKSRPQHGDVLVTKDGTLGRVALFQGGPACINQSVAVLRVNEMASSEFVALALSGGVYQDRMVFDAGGTTIKHIYISRLVKMPIAIPSLEEQEEIVLWLRHRLEQIDQLVTAANDAISLMAERRASVITAAVTGQIDVRGAAARVDINTAQPAHA